MDQKIGTCQTPNLKKFMGKGEEEPAAKLKLQLGKNGGLVHLTVKYVAFDSGSAAKDSSSATDSVAGSAGQMSTGPRAPKAERVRGTVIVEVLRGVGLRQISQGWASGLTGDKQDPRVVVVPDWDDENDKSTAPHHEGGSEPKWEGLENVLKFPYDSLRANKKQLGLQFEVLDEAGDDDTPIGDGQADWEDVYEAVCGEDLGEIEIPLEFDDEKAGSIFVKISFKSKASQKKLQEKGSDEVGAKEGKDSEVDVEKKAGLVTIQIRNAKDLPSSWMDTIDP